MNSEGPMNAILLPSGLTDRASGPRLSPRATVLANSRSNTKLSEAASYSAKDPREQALNRKSPVGAKERPMILPLCCLKINET